MTDESPRLSRRTFLQGTAAGIGLAALGTACPADPESDPGDIDAHSHVWCDDVEKYPLAGKFTVNQLIPRTFTPEQLLELVEKNGIRRVVLIQHQVYLGTDNSYMTDTLARFPGRFSAVAYIDAARDDVTEEMDRLHRQGVRGLRICAGDGGVDRWSESPGMKAMWKHGAEIGMAMCPQIFPDYLSEVDRLCEMFPETTVVIDHFAKIGYDGEIRESDLDQLAKIARHPRANCKISAFYGIGDKQPPYDEIVPMIRRMHEAYGAERLMWASDCPYQLFFGQNNTYEASIGLIREGCPFLSEQDKRQLLRHTAERVFFS